jgi:ABC-2 type transport system permease protein
VVLIPRDFEKDLFNGKQTSLSSYCDASYLLMYKQTLTGVLQSSLTFSAGVELKRLMAKGSSMAQAISQVQPVKVKYTNLYNPSSAYGSFAMPAIIIFILQQTLLIGIGLMGGFQREHGRHIHTIRGFGNAPSAIILGKSLTYALITLFNSLFALVCVHHWFHFPMSSGYFNLFLLLIPFVFATIFMGISISAIFKKAEHSIMVLVFLSLIIIFLTGFSWPVTSLPKALQYIRLIFPCNIIIEPYLRVREMGVPLVDVSKELIMITSQMLGYFVLTLFIFKAKRRKKRKALL